MRADDDESEGYSRGEMRRRRVEAAQGGGAAGGSSFATGSEDAVPVMLDAANVKGSVTEWVTQEAVRQQIKKHFRAFLLTCAPLASHPLPRSPCLKAPACGSSARALRELCACAIVAEIRCGCYI